jgi:NADPH:quinone reductase-like Zn-dependent oxidoreductase
VKAIVWTKYGPPEVLQLKEVEKPAPKEDEVLVRIYATPVSVAYCEIRNGTILARPFTGLTRPKNPIPGAEFGGEIEAVGVDVKRFKEGDQVFGSTNLGFGCYAEYISLPEEGVLAIKPAKMTYEEAAAGLGEALTALAFLRDKGNIQSGQRVLINGASGSIGTYAVQLAKHFGAAVTAVDSTGKLDMLRSIGADQVIDYTQEDFTKRGEIYDVIFDVVDVISLPRSNRSLKQNGTYLLANPGSQMVQGLWTRMTSSKKVIMETASGTIEDLIFLRGLIEAGKIKSVIDRRYPLEQTAEAHKYVETGQKAGNVVIMVDHNNKT